MNAQPPHPGRTSAPPLPRSLRRVLVALLYPAYLGCLICFAVGQSGGHAAPLFFTMSGLCFLVVLGILIRLFVRKSSLSIINGADRDLDERQRHVRDQAYRVAYALLVVAIAVIAALAFTRTPEELSWLISHQVGVGVFGLLFLLAVSLPRVVLAWSEPDPLQDEAGLPAM